MSLHKGMYLFPLVELVDVLQIIKALDRLPPWTEQGPPCPPSHSRLVSLLDNLFNIASSAEADVDSETK